MSKITLSEFREIKSSMIHLVELIDQNYNAGNSSQDEEEILKEYDVLQDRLLSSDLSDIPFEEWQGVYLLSEGELDLSKTHANIDFSILDGIDYDSINLQGCNVRGMQVLNYNEKTFSPEFMNEYPEYFPDESIPFEIRKLFYDKKLIFSDLIKYPALRKYVNEHSFEKLYPSPSNALVVAIGFNNAIRLFDENPNFVSSITREEKSDLDSSSRAFKFKANPPFDKNRTYEEAKKFVYKQILDEVRQGYSIELPSLDALPQEMIDSFPSVFIKDGELPEDVVKDYYNGNLSIREIIHYSEILKTKDLEIGTHSSSKIRAVIKAFGDVWKFIEQIPREYYDIVGSYLSNFAYDNDKLTQIASKTIPKLISDSIKNDLQNLVSRNYYNLDELYAYYQYDVPIEELFKNANTRSFIYRCGFDNIVEFNRKNDRILESKFEQYYSSTLLDEMAKYVSVIGDDTLVTDEQQLSNIFVQIIHQMRISDGYFNVKPKIKRILSALYPSEFIDYNMLDNLLKDMDEKQKENLIEQLERGFNGDTKCLFEILSKNKFLLPTLASKNLVVDKHNWNLNNFYQHVGKKKFLEMCSKYGNGIIQILNSLYNDKIEEFISQISVDDYEQQMNQHIYDLLSREICRTFDIRILPESFKNEHPELYLDSNAPQELREVFYGSISHFGNYELLDAEDIQKHPEWLPFLMKIDLSKCLEKKDIHFYHSQKVDASSTYFIGQSMNLYEALGIKFSQLEILELIAKYGKCFQRINFYLDVSLDKEDCIIKSMYASIKRSPISYLDQRMPKEFKDKYPELFIDEKAPQELKEAFYGYLSKPLNFEFLKQHKDYLQYLEGKDVLLSLKRGNIGIRGLEQLFEKYGEQEALRIGMKNPESVMQMLSENKFNILSAWYDKLHFIPHHVVMREFPFEQSDKFAASGKKWSQLMRIERYNVNEDSKAALLKASMCFGVFDNDMDGFNKTMQLFSDIPKTLSPQDVQRMLDYIQSKVSSLKENSDSKAIEEYNKQLELIQQCYGKNEDGIFALKINSQQNKSTVQILKSIMESAEVSTVLTPDKAHILFGGFEMKYDPDFRDFILKNMDTILSSDEYISYISSMQKQWADIKATNSNRVLTLDLALAFVKSNNYENVQAGNQKLAEVSSMAGYDQKSFETLQQIYNYGKARTFSSIPRVHTTSGEYTYEILRLDDPLAVAIGTLTDCCQELGNAAETSMAHSMVDKNGRVFVIKDGKGNIVAQSWVWRNKNVLCFDNIEIPKKAFTRACSGGSSREQFTDTVFALYQQAGQELISKDEEEFKKLYEEGKITEEQYEALKLGKVTVGTGYNDIADSLRRNSQQDKSNVARPLGFVPPADLPHSLYTSDSKTQYVIAGKQDVIESSYETPTIYSDEFITYDNSNTKQQDVLILQKLELVTKGDNYSGKTQSDETEKIVSDIAYNYGLNPETTRIIMNANFAIIYDTTRDEVVVGDVLYNTSFNNQGQQVDISNKVAMQIRMAIEQIGVKGKKIDISRLDQEQLEMCNRAMNLDREIDNERGLLHVAR